MPLAVMCGYPCAGKSWRANQLAGALRAQGCERVHVVNETSLGIRRCEGYASASAEKQTRGALKSEVERLLSADTIVIVDSLNYIKGFRYELHCVARLLKTPLCVVHAAASQQQCLRWFETAGSETKSAIESDVRQQSQTALSVSVATAATNTAANSMRLAFAKGETRQQQLGAASSSAFVPPPMQPPATSATTSTTTAIATAVTTTAKNVVADAAAARAPQTPIQSSLSAMSLAGPSESDGPVACNPSASAFAPCGNTIVPLSSSALALAAASMAGSGGRNNSGSSGPGLRIAGSSLLQVSQTQAQPQAAPSAAAAAAAAVMPAAMDTDDMWDVAQMSELISRFECPDGRNRWDSPLFTLAPEDVLPADDIYAALCGKTRLVRPTAAATQSQPLEAATFLHELDAVTQAIARVLLQAQAQGGVASMAGTRAKVAVPGTEELVTLSRPVAPAEMRRLRRQFSTYTRMHPPGDSAKLPTLFVAFLNATL